MSIDINVHTVFSYSEYIKKHKTPSVLRGRNRVNPLMCMNAHGFNPMRVQQIELGAGDKSIDVVKELLEGRIKPSVVVYYRGRDRFWIPYLEVYVKDKDNQQ